MIRIVTDSTASVPPDLIESHNIVVVPLRVLFGQESYRDGVDMTNEEFYTRLATVDRLPTTSQPTVAEFFDVYQRIVEAGDQVVSIHLSSKLSGTYNAAAQAAAEFLPGAVSVLDTNWISLPLTFQVRAAAEAAAQGAAVEDVVAAVQRLDPRLHLYFVLDTLENLRKGGRISGAKAMIGGLLHVKPILELKDGAIEPVESPRSKKASIRRLLELMDATIPAGAPLHVAVIDARAPSEREEMERQIQERFNVVEILRAEVGSIIGTHTGTGAVGAGYFTD
ncbi:MAG: DegV family protein [Anaerolineae bacterium]